MVYLQHCDTYDRDVILKKVKEIFEAFGGIEKYASEGKNVVIKPNMVGKKKPEEAATTHPSIVYAVAKLCREHGANVTIAESGGGTYDLNSLRSSYRTCGMEEAAKDAGAELNFDVSESEVEYADAMYLKKIGILTPLAKADTVISISKLKTHGMMTYTGAVKNLFGAIPGLKKAEYHFKMSNYDDFANCLIDICNAVHPDLSIIDGIVGMEKDGPTAGDPKKMNVLISSEDPYEADLAAVKIIDCEPDRIPILRNAIARGICPDSVDKIEIKGAPISEFPSNGFIVKYNDDQKRIHFVGGPAGEWFAKAVRPRPVFLKDKCRSCGECAKCCPAKVITVEKGKTARVNLKGCIRCFCCQELCPFHAVEIRKPLINRLFISKGK